MSITNHGEKYKARIEENFYKDSLYLRVVDNLSSEIQSRANKLNISDLEGSSFTIVDYVKDTAITQAMDTGTDAQHTLEINKSKAGREYIDLKDSRQFQSNQLIDVLSKRASRKMIAQVDSDIKTVLFKTGDFTTANKNLATTANFSDTTTENFVDKLIEDILDCVELGDRLHWPDERIMVTSPSVKRVLASRILSENVGSGSGVRGFDQKLSNFLGFNVLIDTDIEKPNSVNNPVCLFLTRPAIKFAQNIDRVEVDDRLGASLGLFGTAISWLASYGILKVFPNQAILLKANA